MYELFIYNEDMCVVTISFNSFEIFQSTKVFDNYNDLEYILGFNDYYFDNNYWKKKKCFYAWTTIADMKYFEKGFITPRKIASHGTLYKGSYIYWIIPNFLSLTNIDYSLNTMWLFFNVVKNNNFFFFNKSSDVFNIFGVSLWVDELKDTFFLSHLWFYDAEALRSNVSFFLKLNPVKINTATYFTIFDFEKFYMNYSDDMLRFRVLLYPKETVLRYSRLGMFLVNNDFSMYNNFFFKYLSTGNWSFFENTNHKAFYLNFILNKWFEFYTFFLGHDTYSFVFEDSKTYRLHSNLNVIFNKLDGDMKIFNLNKSYYYYQDFSYFDFLFSKILLNFDIYLNFLIKNKFLFSNYNDNYLLEKLIDTTVSNVHLYRVSDLFFLTVSPYLDYPFFRQVQSFLGESEHFYFKSISYKTSNNIDYLFFLKGDNYFVLLRKYFFLYNINLNNNYYYFFFKNLSIDNFLIFNQIKIKTNLFVYFIFLFLFLLYIWYKFYLYLVYIKNYKKLSIDYNLLILNNFLMFFLVFLNLEWKLNNNNFMFITNKFFLKQRRKDNEINRYLSIFNFDLILFLYCKFIVKITGYRYFKEHYKIMRFENLILNISTVLQDKNRKFLYKHLFFLLLLFFYYIIFLIYIVIFKFFGMFIISGIFVFDENFKREYSFNWKPIFLNLDGRPGFLWDFVSSFFTSQLFFRFWTYMRIYYKKNNVITATYKKFLKKYQINKLLEEFYVKLSDAGFLFSVFYVRKFIYLFRKHENLFNLRFNLLYEFYFLYKHYIIDLGVSKLNVNVERYLNIFEFNAINHFVNLNFFEINEVIRDEDNIFFDILWNNKPKTNKWSTIIFINIEFENIILKPISKLIKKIFFNNFIFMLLFQMKFLKYYKFEIYFKFIFSYFFFVFYVFFSIFVLKSNKKFYNFTIIYNFFIIILKFKYFFLICFELIFNKTFFYIYLFLKKCFFIFFLYYLLIYVFDIDFIYFGIWLNSIFYTTTYIYICFFFVELFNYIFEQIFIQKMFNLFFQNLHSFVIWHEFNVYFTNYKIYIETWNKVLNDYYYSFFELSTRKAYSINAKVLLYHKHGNSFYAWIPHSFIHTFIRVIYVIIFEKLPDSWIFGIQYFGFFYRLGWDLLGLYIADSDDYTIIDHIIRGFFMDSIFHKYYIGYEYNNLWYYYYCFELKNFFKKEINFSFWFFYRYLTVYFIFEFFLLKFFNYLIFFFNIIFDFILLHLKNIFLILKSMWINIIWIYYIISNLYLYFFYLYLEYFWEKIYIILYTFFFIKSFLNLFLFLYNIFIYYQEILYNFLNMDLDFIKKNRINFKYKLIEDVHPLGYWFTYPYKFKQDTLINNVYKEPIFRHIFIYELKNLFFFKTYYGFYTNINRIAFFFFSIYLFFLYRIFQYFLVFFTKWFYYIFFNNTNAVSINPELTWEKWELFTKKNSYYFNEGLTHIIGGNQIFHYFHYFNNDLDKYLFEKKKQYLNSDKKNTISEEFSKSYNNILLFQNQKMLTKNLLKLNFSKDNYLNWYITTLIFFKNYNFYFYNNMDNIIVKYDDLFGDYCRPWIELHNKKNIISLSKDKYNYFFLPPSARLAYTDLFTHDWVFYQNFQSNSRIITKKKIINYDELFYLRLQFPFLIFWLTYKDLVLKKNDNLKYLFPLLIPEKKIWILYEDLFLHDKEKVRDMSSIPMSAEWLTFLNKSRILAQLSVAHRFDFNHTFNDLNYKGVWNSIFDNDLTLFTTYLGWSVRIVKKPKLIDAEFTNWIKSCNILVNSYSYWLLNISKRYFNHVVPTYNHGDFFLASTVTTQNLFKNLNLRSYEFEFDLKEMEDLGTLSYLKEMNEQDAMEPFTEEEWKVILRSYVQNSFFLGDDGIILMQIYRTYVDLHYVGRMNVAYGVYFFFVPIYSLIIDTEIFYELASGFVFKGGLKQPIRTGLVKAMESYISLADFDMQDERYFYIHIIEHEFVNKCIRLFHEIFYFSTKYFNSYDNLNFMKKNNILFNDDVLVNPIRNRFIYRKASRLFKSYSLSTEPDRVFEETWRQRFFMQEPKRFYVFSDLSYTLPFFLKQNNNLFWLFYNLNFVKQYILELVDKETVVFEFLDFFENLNPKIEKINSVSLYNNLVDNNQNWLDFFYFIMSKSNTNNYFFNNIETSLNFFYYYIFNKQKEFLYDLDKLVNEPSNYIINKITYGPYFYDLGYLIKNGVGFDFYDPWFDVVENDFMMWPTLYYNTYFDILGPRWFINYYAANPDDPTIIEEFNVIDQNIFSYADYQINRGKHKIWKRRRVVWRMVYRWPERIFVFPGSIQLDNFLLIRDLPITSFYLKNFNLSYFLLDSSFLENYIKTAYWHNDDILYIDKARLTIDENKKLWQFSILLNNFADYVFLPFFEIFLYYVSGFFIIFVPIFVFWRYFTLILHSYADIDMNNMFFNYKANKWFYISKTVKKSKSKVKKNLKKKLKKKI